MFKKKEENKTLDILLKVFLAVGIVAGICVIAKILYDKYKQKLCLLCDDDCDCNFECLDNDGIDCDCDNCEYAGGADKEEEEAETEEAPEAETEA